MSGLETVLCVGGTQLSRLHDERDETGGEGQQKQRVGEAQSMEEAIHDDIQAS